MKIPIPKLPKLKIRTVLLLLGGIVGGITGKIVFSETFGSVPASICFGLVIGLVVNWLLYKKTSNDVYEGGPMTFRYCLGVALPIVGVIGAVVAVVLIIIAIALLVWAGGG